MKKFIPKIWVLSVPGIDQIEFKKFDHDKIVSELKKHLKNLKEGEVIHYFSYNKNFEKNILGKYTRKNGKLRRFLEYPGCWTIMVNLNVDFL